MDKKVDDVITLGRKAILAITIASILAIVLILGTIILVALRLSQ